MLWVQKFPVAVRKKHVYAMPINPERRLPAMDSHERHLPARRRGRRTVHEDSRWRLVYNVANSDRKSNVENQKEQELYNDEV